MNLTKIKESAQTRSRVTCRSRWPVTAALLSLCLLTLSGCSEKTYSAPMMKVGPCLLPEYNAAVWGDYPPYVAEVTSIVLQCNKRWAETQKLNERNFQ